MDACMKSILQRATDDLAALLPRVAALAPTLEKLGQAMMTCWAARGKVLIAGNGGSAADALHFAEELVVRFQKNRKGLAALALCDASVITCAANDLGYDLVFSRQVGAFGDSGGGFVAVTTSGDSGKLLKGVAAAEQGGVVAGAVLREDGGGG